MAKSPAKFKEMLAVERFGKSAIPSFTREANLFEEDKPHSVVNVVSDGIKDYILTAKGVVPDFFNLDEQSLKKRFKEQGISFSRVDNILRIKFWMEYERCAVLGSSFVAANIFTGVCTKQFFYGMYLKQAHKVAFMLTPPLDYEASLIETLEFADDQIRGILEIDHIDPKTKKIDYKLLEIKMKIKVMAENRLLGSVVQRVQGTIDSRSLNVNLDATNKQVQEYAEMLTDEQMDKKILELEGEVISNSTPPAPMIEDALTVQEENAVERVPIPRAE